MNENAKYGGQITMRYLSFRNSSWWQTTHDTSVIQSNINISIE